MVVAVAELEVVAAEERLRVTKPAVRPNEVVTVGDRFWRNSIDRIGGPVHVRQRILRQLQWIGWNNVVKDRFNQLVDQMIDPSMDWSAVRSFVKSCGSSIKTQSKCLKLIEKYYNRFWIRCEWAKLSTNSEPVNGGKTTFPKIVIRVQTSAVLCECQSVSE